MLDRFVRAPEEAQYITLDQKTIKTKADALGVSPEFLFTELGRANRVYKTFVDMGPFYGVGREPTFRVSAEPIVFPEAMRPQLEQLGNDVALLSEVLPGLPEDAKRSLGSVDFRTPLSWRLDTIFDTNGDIRVNEVQVADGADALMTAEQVAYGLQDVMNATPAYLARAYRQAIKTGGGRSLTVAILRENLESPYTPNILRMNEMIEKVSDGTVKREIVPTEAFRAADWLQYDGIVNEAYTNIAELKRLGVPLEKIISAGDFTAVGNKGLYPLLYDPKLEIFWRDTIGEERLQRLRKSFIPSSYLETENEITVARENGRVVKGSWMEGNVGLLDKARSVYGPWSTDEEWEKAYEQFQAGMQFIGQDFIEPARLSAFLRAKGGKDLERVDWYNRVCLKYVRDTSTNTMAMTAVEVTLGPNPKPAGRNCCFTAGTFKG